MLKVTAMHQMFTEGNHLGPTSLTGRILLESLRCKAIGHIPDHKMKMLVPMQAREKHSYQTLNLQNEQDFPLKQELPFIQRRRARPAIFSKLFSTSVRMAHSSLNTQSRPASGVKAFVPSGGHGNAGDSLSTASIKDMPSLGFHSSVSTSNSYSQYSKSRDQGSDMNIGEPAKNEFSSTSQATISCNDFSNAVYQQISVQQP